jgi:hypothetical protein
VQLIGDFVIDPNALSAAAIMGLSSELDFDPSREGVVVELRGISGDGDSARKVL